MCTGGESHSQWPTRPQPDRALACTAEGMLPVLDAMKISGAYIAMQQALAAYRERYMAGDVAWIAAGEPDLDADRRYHGPRVLQWHGPPLALPDAYEYAGARMAPARDHGQPAIPWPTIPGYASSVSLLH